MIIRFFRGKNCVLSRRRESYTIKKKKSNIYIMRSKIKFRNEVNLITIFYERQFKIASSKSFFVSSVVIKAMAGRLVQDYDMTANKALSSHLEKFFFC